MKGLMWILWLVLTLLGGGYYLYTLTLSEDKSPLLIGEASHGHYQIELACGSCHTEAFGGGEVLQDACVNCHGDELKEAHDSHPKKKFTDPRNADLLQIIDARYCVSCHTEHQQEQTRPMGLTLPTDYCFHCHQNIGEDRPSHKDLAFDSCASAGCHNYHDNRALYERFLVENSGGIWLQAIAEIDQRNHASLNADRDYFSHNRDYHDRLKQHPEIHEEWLASRHAEANINCGGCHTSKESAWIEKPGLEQCSTCHQQEADGFLASKHGMRQAARLGAMTPEQSSLMFNKDAFQMQHSCSTCHKAHSYKAKEAATSACLVCHSDTHSRNFESSPHGKLAKFAENGDISAKSVVTCATCHMPSVADTSIGTKVVNGESVAVVRVEHNQNATLRPNEKMIRPVCMQCHSLEFAIDALADPQLIDSNFTGKPAAHVPSIDWAKQRE